MSCYKLLFFFWLSQTMSLKLENSRNINEKGALDVFIWCNLYLALLQKYKFLKSTQIQMPRFNFPAKKN